MLICKECRCYHPVSGSDRYCGECCIGETRNPIAINADIVGCCLFEPKQPKSIHSERSNIMDDYDRVKECVQGLQILLDCAEELPEYICSSESYPIDKTTVLRDIKLSSFYFVIGEAMEIIEHGIKNHGNIF